MFNRDNLVDEGRLLVSSYAMGLGRPIGAAQVRIMTRGGGNTIEVVRTDSSGRAPLIYLPAPPVEYSMSLEQGQPFSEYDVEVTLEGFESVRVNGVQIYPESTALQDVDLAPQVLEEETLDEINIEPPTLWGNFPPKIPEADVKPLPEPGGLVVLNQVVIPEFIVVHAGRPTDTQAPNFWVPFKDYIKNVASSEIYPTWPEETLRANIMAIISFTLNRVFTEWYRGKGFDFTVTNSTAFDQAFTHGRNIFVEVSNVVDDIFSTYITRPGIRQPLLTQYCDGKRVTCPRWLSQWGSKYLGDKGYKALSILQNYYGYEIYLNQAEKVEGIPISFPGYALTIGASGPDARRIQEQLNTISKHYPAIPRLVEDGIYGSKTQESVKAFQSIFKMPVSGIVDFATWYRIASIYVAVTRMGELY